MDTKLVEPSVASPPVETPTPWQQGRAARLIVHPAVLALVAMLVLSACAAGPNPSTGSPSAEGDVAGFWLGLWHGVIVPVTFVISLFSDTVAMYEVHNNGGWYDFGFLLGASVFLGGGGAGAKSTRL